LVGKIEGKLAKSCIIIIADYSACYFYKCRRVRHEKQERRKGREKEGEGGRESKIVKTERKRGFEKVLEGS
jgi:hypothetical protein